ncbi:MAG: hypothetical protein A2798_03955 [Candidatus Levybacteria bacterium RIFCSPHIGHO2_01_FULL_37_17]|nr:MAG: hypothetical protein A2798_03955 [Candidatus Levybacteria bacterium RIFCSPHIGHO2_01_FULL_37_17]OGH36622.1 MAG: hypothetical protein A2959_04010 [Candidatus Levybacteria bacterium RIFCSPLOWO2_01_FULL_38_23]
MVEQELIQSEEQLVQHIYSDSLDLLEKYGKRFFKEDGIDVTAEGFFCDSKDQRGSSDISFYTDAWNGFKNPVIVSTTRRKNNKEITRALTFHNFKVTKLVISERDIDRTRIKVLYSGVMDKGQVNLDLLSEQIEEARINLEAGASESPCEDPRRPRFITLAPKLKEKLFGIFPSKRKAP